MALELEARKTPVDRKEMFQALAVGWSSLFKETPKKESVLLLLAHWALETGWGRSMWCYNLGNVKAGRSWKGRYCYFKCNEVLSHEAAGRYARGDPDRTKITRIRSDGKSIIWFYPKHACCKFRAFDTLEEGAVDHLTLLKNHKNFSKAWGAVVAGDPELFCIKLRRAGYFTADLDRYTRAVTRCFYMCKQSLVDVEVPSMEVPSVVDPSVFEPLEEFEESPLETPDPDEMSEFYSPFSSSEEEE